MDKKSFYQTLRAEGINLTTQNVIGFERCVDYLVIRDAPLGSASYAMATAFWETAQTMHPVREAYWMSEGWRKRNLRYYPFYGRGIIQTTWEDGYRRAGKLISDLTGKVVDCVRKPDLLLQWEYALPAWYEGMEAGIYTNKSNEDYIDNIDESDAEDQREYRNARRIVNLMDKADTIAKLAITMEHAFKASDWPH